MQSELFSVLLHVVCVSSDYLPLWKVHLSILTYQKDPKGPKEQLVYFFPLIKKFLSLVGREPNIHFWEWIEKNLLWKYGNLMTIIIPARFPFAFILVLCSELHSLFKTGSKVFERQRCFPNDKQSSSVSVTLPCDTRDA